MQVWQYLKLPNYSTSKGDLMEYNIPYNRRKNESFLDYAERLLEGKVTGLYDIDYTEMYHMLFEKDISSDEARKRSYMLRDILDKVKEEEIQSLEDKSELQKLRDKIGEYDIKKRQMQIERNGLNKLKRDLIPSVVIADELAQFMVDNKMQINIPEYCFNAITNKNEEYELIVQLSDFHIGYVIDNCKGNSFNWKIANERIDKLIEEIHRTVKLYDITDIHVVNTGDMIEQIAMRKNQSQFCEFGQAEQINKAIEIIYRFLIAMCERSNVTYYSVAGNHDRMNGDAKANYKGDNADVVITRQLYNYNEIAKMNNGNSRLTIVENDPFNEEILLEVNGTKHKFIHGDGKFKDGAKLIKSEMSMDDDSYNLWRGHYHNFNVQSENNGRYIISSGCLSGYNDYSRNFGAQTSASQTIAVIGDGKIELIKDVQLQ